MISPLCLCVCLCGTRDPLRIADLGYEFGSGVSHRHTHTGVTTGVTSHPECADLTGKPSPGERRASYPPLVKNGPI
jgi:hypothetical protein